MAKKTSTHHGFSRTQIEEYEAVQVMWSVLRDHEQVSNVQKSLPDEMVRIAQLSYLPLLCVLVSSEMTRLF
jgi:hypothetical protein